ncbi:hypothetical protein POG22_14540 [Geitlerinema sp. CS-897]|uniref:hypothetical protein n=1 Tax=Baaleninema simplex TaxID=2862350 RepID=UPI00034CAE0E|nr:hypothetical protein [Baaleninema simplex]MDC0834214.1 hypothetical protein [Geitlerinema sp. CS-897]
MPKLNVRQKNWLLSAHVSFAALWTGSVVSIFLLSLKNQQATDVAETTAFHAAANLLDDWIVIPSAIGAVVTATALCWVTNYGFTKFYWVMAKWGLTTALIGFGTGLLFPWSHTAERLSALEGLQAAIDPIYQFDTRAVLWGSAFQVVLLLVIIGISVLKPWGRRTLKSSLKTESR